MSYIQKLRTLVGNMPLIMVGAGVLVFDGMHRLLLLRRSDNHLWGIPGGAMEPGETLEETALREIREETSLNVKRLAFFGVFSGPDLYYRYPNGAQVYNVSAIYLTRLIDGEIHLNDSEHTDYRYFEIDALPQEISPPIEPVLMDLVQRFQSNPGFLPASLEIPPVKE